MWMYRLGLGDLSRHMKCVNYNQCGNRTGASQRKICWKEWRMCGDCAIRFHPEAYSDMYIRRALTRMRKKYENSK